MGLMSWLFGESNVEEGGGKTNWTGEPSGPTNWWTGKPEATDDIDPAGWTW